MTMRQLIGAAFILWSLGCSTAPGTETRKPESGDPVLAIYPEDHGMGERDPESLVVAIWTDGRVVWSKDRLNGGAPYLAGRIDAEDVRSLLSRFEQDGLFADETLGNARFGPDSAYTTLLVRSGKKQLQMKSWHEVFEANGKAVAGRHGVSGLEGRRRLEALRNEPADYLFYRFVWSETRGRIIDLIPNEGKPVEGTVEVTGRGISWTELPAGTSK